MQWIYDSSETLSLSCLFRSPSCRSWQTFENRKKIKWNQESEKTVWTKISFGGSILAHMNIETVRKSVQKKLGLPSCEALPFVLSSFGSALKFKIKFNTLLSSCSPCNIICFSYFSKKTKKKKKPMSFIHSNHCYFHSHSHLHQN